MEDKILSTSKYWKGLYNKKVRLIVKDTNYPKPRDGIFVDIDNTHIFLKTKFKTTPFNRDDIKRVELRE